MANTNDSVISLEEYRAFQEEVAKKEGKPKPRKPVNANYTSYVLNGVEDNTLVKTDKIEVVSVSGPTDVKAGELATYTITAYKGEPTEKDKKRIYWSVYIDGKKSNRIRLQNDKENADSALDIYLGNKKNKAFIVYIKKSPQEDKIELKFSKWLDGKEVKVEAHKGMNSFDNSCQIKTMIIAKPEILSIHWVNAKEQKIKFSGYDQDVFLAVKTLGLKGKKLTLDIFDYDRYKEDDPLDWGENSITIKQRKTLKQFPIKKRSDYGLQEKDDLTPSLELYVVAKSSEPLENPKEKYAYYLNLTPNELIRNAYFAEEEHIEVQKGEEKKPEPPKPPPAKPSNYTVVKGDDLAKIAKKKDVPYTQIMDANPYTKWELLIPNKTILVIPVKKEIKKAKAKNKDTKTVTYYQKIDASSLGSEVHLVAETSNLEGKKVTFKVFERDPILLTSKDKPVPLLVGNTEKTEIEATVKDGKAQVKVSISRKAEKAQKDWEKKLSPTEEKIEGWYYDVVDDLSVHMVNPFDIRFIMYPDRYTPATIAREAKKTYLWLQITCKGDQRDFDIPFLKGNSFEVDYSDRAPWMKYAKEEYKTYKGILEKNSPLKEKIEEYLNTTNSKGSKYTTPWCGAFVNWCFNQTKDYKNTNVGLNALAFDWGTKEVAKKSRHKPDGWVNGETCDAFVGAVIVLSYSHTAFIVGKNTKKGRYVYLGGNQGGKISGIQQIRYGTVKIGSELSIMKPKSYKITPKEKELPELKVLADGSFKSTR